MTAVAAAVMPESITAPVAAPVADKATRRAWIGLAVLAVPCLLYSMDLTILNLALPHLAADLHPSSTQQLWIIDIYGFVLAGSLITMGTLGDRIGRRRLLLLGAGAFGVMSILASFATSPTMLVVTRALLGLAGATIAPSTLSLIHAMFKDSRQRLFAIGVWTAAFSAGGLLGPVIGGVVLDHTSWRAVFWLGIPAMIALVTFGRSLLPEVKADKPARFDVPSALLSMGAILLAVYGIKAIAHGDRGVPFVIAGAAVAAVFVRRQRRAEQPLVDLAMFRDPAVATALATYMLGLVVVFGFYVIVAQYLQLVAGLSAMGAGLALVPSSMGFLVGSLTMSSLTRERTPRRVLSIGLVVGAIGLVAVVAIGGVIGVMIGTFVLSLGLAPVAPLASAIVLEHASEDQAGAAAGMSETSAELGGALGIALLGSLLGAVYRSHDGAIGDSLADAVTRGTTSDALAGAQRAFEHGFELTAIVGAVVLVMTAGVVLRGLRSRAS